MEHLDDLHADSAILRKDFHSGPGGGAFSPPAKTPLQAAQNALWIRAIRTTCFLSGSVYKTWALPGFVGGTKGTGVEIPKRKKLAGRGRKYPLGRGREVKIVDGPAGACPADSARLERSPTVPHPVVPQDPENMDGVRNARLSFTS